MKETMKKHKAAFGLELASHFYYKDYYYSDSAMITIAIMLKLISEGLDFSSELAKLEENYPMSGEVNYKIENPDEVISNLEKEFGEGEVNKIDGLSVSYPKWRFNIRKSNTEPVIRLNVEGESKEMIIEKFRQIETLIPGQKQNTSIIKELN